MASGSNRFILYRRDLSDRAIERIASNAECDGVFCDNSGQMHCISDLRYGKETVGRQWGFYCAKCFEEHCAGKSWESAPNLYSFLQHRLGLPIKNALQEYLKSQEPNPNL